MQKIIGQIAAELKVGAAQVTAAVELLDGGATVPFIARYRKEATGGLDDAQLRELQVRLAYLRELDERRGTVLKAIDEQGKLTDALRLAIAQVATKQELEDIYLPFKQKRRTKGQIAKEFGIEPLADQLLADPTLDPHEHAQAYCQPATVLDDGKPGPDFSTPQAVLDGVRDILSERWAEDAALVQKLREWLWADGLLRSSLVAGKNEQEPEVAKFRDYFDYEEPIGRIPSHRALAVFRGRSLEILDAKLVQPQEPVPGQMSLAEGHIALHLGWSHQNRKSDDLLRKCVTWTWRVKLSLSIERDLFTRLREAAEAVAIKVFGDNLRDLLLAAPAGPRAVMGLDPLVQRHGVQLIAIGNGTASRETDKLAADVIKLVEKTAQAQSGKALAALQKIVVSEAGASVYSASEFASQELPDVDVSLRGAVSIARRLQDPLAELVKIDPKSIGVGQYQHDVNQSDLARQLGSVVEDCVNAVGVDLNTASAPLLARVSGLSATVAKSVVRWRDAHGRFQSRKQLLEVSGLGPKTFEQAAGFLRIRGGVNPLDMTGVHPETYPVVERILQATKTPIEALMGRSEQLQKLNPAQFADERFGAITVRDILGELEKPGRDPRPDFVVARFNDGVESIADLKEGMVLEGTVSNVAQFGAFVDLGVHQDGLVHVSQMSHKFVEDAREVVKTGQIVKVKVLEVDAPRKRISLTMKLDAAPARRDGPRDNRFEAAGRGSNEPARRGDRGERRDHQPSGAAGHSAMASAFAKLQGLKK